MSSLADFPVTKKWPPKHPDRIQLVGFCGAGDLVEFHQYVSARRALDAFVARPAVQRGLTIPKRD